MKTKNLVHHNQISTMSLLIRLNHSQLLKICGTKIRSIRRCWHLSSKYWPTCQPILQINRTILFKRQWTFHSRKNSGMDLRPMAALSSNYIKSTRELMKSRWSKKSSRAKLIANWCPTFPIQTRLPWLNFSSTHSKIYLKWTTLKKLLQ